MAHDAASQRNHRSHERIFASTASRLDFNRILCRAPITTWISATHGTNSRSYGLLTWSWDDRDCFETAHRSRFARTAGTLPVQVPRGAGCLVRVLRRQHLQEVLALPRGNEADRFFVLSLSALLPCLTPKLYDPIEGCASTVSVGKHNRNHSHRRKCQRATSFSEAQHRRLVDIDGERIWKLFESFWL